MLHRPLAAALCLALGPSASAAVVGLRPSTSRPPVAASALPIVAPIPTLPAPTGMRWGGESAFSGLRRVPELGRGEFGVVYDHPDDPGAVVKLTADNEDSIYNTFTGPRPREVMESQTVEEAQGLRWLEEAGAGPRLLGVTRVRHRLADLWSKLSRGSDLFADRLSRPALVKEKVFGETVAELRRAGAFGREEEAMVEDLRARLVAAGVLVWDERDDNVMIGSTASHPGRRAWLVDAGLLEVRPAK